MKLYDLVFLAATALGLSTFHFSGAIVRALISGGTIGAYIAWRIMAARYGEDEK